MKQNSWFDPFFVFESLSEEDKLIQKNVKNFSEDVLKPNVVEYNKNHHFDLELYKPMVFIYFFNAFTY